VINALPIDGEFKMIGNLVATVNIHSISVLIDAASTGIYDS
jgi:hypothetical protein